MDVIFNPEYAVNFVARVESAMAARVSLRRNSPSYFDERKLSEALAATAISGRSRNPTAYSGFKEDVSRLRKGHAHLNMATIRRTALNICKLDGSPKLILKRKRMAAAASDEFRDQLLRL